MRTMSMFHGKVVKKNRVIPVTVFFSGSNGSGNMLGIYSRDGWQRINFLDEQKSGEDIRLYVHFPFVKKSERGGRR